MIDSFIKYLRFEKRVSANTTIAYQNDLTQFSEFLNQTFSQPSPENADFGMIRSWIVSLVEQNLDPKTVNRKIACLRSFYKHLLRQEVISKNPMTKIRVLKTKKQLPSFIKESDMADMLDGQGHDSEQNEQKEFEKIRSQLILELFYGTGIRLSELIHLSESNVDFRNQTMKVLGKRNKERVIPFGKKLVEVIKSYLQIRNKNIGKPSHQFLLVTHKGEKCYPMLIYRIVKEKLMKYDGVEKKSPHVLRHTYATHLLNNGAEINAVKDLLGHSSLAATQVYTHNSIEKLKTIFEQAHPKA